MPRHAATLLSLLLGAVLHLDWLFARPLHHRLSFGWSNHWIAFWKSIAASAVAFAATLWFCAPRGPVLVGHDEAASSSG